MNVNDSDMCQTVANERKHSVSPQSCTPSQFRNVYSWSSQTVPHHHELSRLHRRGAGCWRTMFFQGLHLAAQLRLSWQLWVRRQHACTTCTHMWSPYSITTSQLASITTGALGVLYPACDVISCPVQALLACWCSTQVSAEAVLTVHRGCRLFWKRGGTLSQLS